MNLRDIFIAHPETPEQINALKVKAFISVELKIWFANETAKLLIVSFEGFNSLSSSNNFSESFSKFLSKVLLNKLVKASSFLLEKKKKEYY